MKGSKEMSDDYEVGYRKPPKKTQFKKGQSGNPKGRPKKSRDRSTIIKEELEQIITVKEGNKTVTMTKGEAVIKQMVNKAIKGDNRATKTVLDLMENEEVESEGGVPLNANDQKILEEFLKTESKQNHD